MDREQLFIVAGAVVAAGYMLTLYYAGQVATGTTSEAEPEPDSALDTSTEPTFLEDLVNTTRNTLQLWKPPAKYAGLIAASEARNGIPTDMLARLLYQESRYRDDIITGRVTSPVGAQGIAQFMPATAKEWGVNPLDPASAIDGAGRYLKWLYAKFGNWSETLAAYNWGIGNVQRKGLSVAPRETRLYYSQILGDVNTSNGTAWA